MLMKTPEVCLVSHIPSTCGNMSLIATQKWISKLLVFLQRDGETSKGCLMRLINHCKRKDSLMQIYVFQYSSTVVPQDWAFCIWHPLPTHMRQSYSNILTTNEYSVTQEENEICAAPQRSHLCIWVCPRVWLMSERGIIRLIIIRPDRLSSSQTKHIFCCCWITDSDFIYCVERRERHSTPWALHFIWHN